jgi:hypothetical protein
MKHQKFYSFGFSAVEAIIALFIAGAFVIAGYQLYSVVAVNSGETRRHAVASNLVYTLLRAATNVIPSAPTCPPIEPTPWDIDGIDLETVDVSELGLSNVTIEAKLSAPFGCQSGQNVLRVEIAIEYGTIPREKVSHAVYAQQQ